jgi:prepilin-type N-terminal cleavage/methylation domain-containing protein
LNMRRHAAFRAAGFTLLELLIALSIVGALLAIAFGGLRMAISAWTRGDDRAEVQQHTRGITQIVGRTVGAACPYRGAFGEVPEKRILFRGTEKRLELVTQAAPFPSVIPVAFTAVVIALEDGALVVRQRILPNREPFSEAAVVLRDPSIQGLELQYLTSSGSWADAWDVDDEKKLPSAIRIRFATASNGKLEPLPPITVSLRAVEPL